MAELLSATASVWHVDVKLCARALAVKGSHQLAAGPDSEPGLPLQACRRPAGSRLGTHELAVAELLSATASVLHVGVKLCARALAGKGAHQLAAGPDSGPGLPLQACRLPACSSCLRQGLIAACLLASVAS